MCMVSNVIYYGINGPWAPYVPNTPKPYPYEIGSGDKIDFPQITITKYATVEQLEAFKKEFEEFKKVIKAALAYDAKTTQPHCEAEDKVAKLKKIADLLGVDISDLDLSPLKKK